MGVPFNSWPARGQKVPKGVCQVLTWRRLPSAFLPLPLVQNVRHRFLLLENNGHAWKPETYDDTVEGVHLLRPRPTAPKRWPFGKHPSFQSRRSPRGTLHTLHAKQNGTTISNLSTGRKASLLQATQWVQAPPGMHRRTPPESLKSFETALALEKHRSYPDLCGTHNAPRFEKTSSYLGARSHEQKAKHILPQTRRSQRRLPTKGKFAACPICQ